jgi:hypothetical protein
MPTAPVTLTLAEAAAILDPPMTERQLRAIITALGWPAAGHRRTGRIGHPFPAYDATRILQLHAALVPFIHKQGLLCARDRMP